MDTARNYSKTIYQSPLSCDHRMSKCWLTPLKCILEGPEDIWVSRWRTSPATLSQKGNWRAVVIGPYLYRYAGKFLCIGSEIATENDTDRIPIVADEKPRKRHSLDW